MKALLAALFLMGLLTLTLEVSAATLILTETMNAEIEVGTLSRIMLASPAARLSCRIVHPPDINTPSSGQRIFDFRLEVQPQPARIDCRLQSNGAKVTELIFENITGPVTLARCFKVQTVRRPDRLSGDYPYPLTRIPQSVRSYLNATELVQKDDSAVSHLSLALVQWLSSQDEAVRMILDWIADNIKPDPAARPTDALSVLNSGRGSAEGLAHLAAAMLRRLEIPTRVVVGVTADSSWRIRTEQTTWLIHPGQGRHVWIEVYFPGQGWVECEPMLSRYLISPFCFRLGEGLDAVQASADGSITWSGGSDRPEVFEKIDLQVLKGPELVAVSEKWDRPQNLVLAASFNPAGQGNSPPREAPLPDQSFRPAKLSRDLVLSWPRLGPLRLESGPSSLSLNRFEDLGGQTAGSARPGNGTVAGLSLGEDSRTYQGVVLDAPFELTGLELALARSVGGTGKVWVEIRSDRDGRPGETAVKTETVTAEQIGTDPTWVNFPLPGDPPLLLMPGIYWLRPISESEATLVWLYSPGNPFGWPSDTLKIYPAPDRPLETMNADFYFCLQGFKRLPEPLAADRATDSPITSRP